VLLGILKGSLGFVGIFAFASFFEWTLHRYLMHSLLWPYPFHAHALVHHGLFRADHSYHLRREQDKPKVTFAWWNAPGLVLLTLPLLLSLGAVFGWPVFWGGLIAEVSYYTLYESLHWCMHVPRSRRVEKTRVFRWLNAHHRVHHYYAFKNLNVVFPLADWLLGSLVPAAAHHPVNATREERTRYQTVRKELAILD
jgi:hypothetical protein